jgi:hypothetical protein
MLKNAHEDLVSLANGPDRRVIMHGSCNIKGARFRMVAREKNLKTQNSGVMAKADIPIGNGDEYYGVLQEVLELQYGRNKHVDRSVFLFRCDWYDLQTKGSKMKDDGFFKSVNTSVLWFKSAPSFWQAKLIHVSTWMILRLVTHGKLCRPIGI